MTNVIDFRAEQRRSPIPLRRAATADILFFMGVRYVREQEPALTSAGRGETSGLGASSPLPKPDRRLA